MNKGLRQARGDYLFFLNSGDALYDIDTLTNFAAHLDGTDIVYGDFVFIYPDGRKVMFKNDKEISYISFLERERILCHQAVLMSGKSIKKAGGCFDESLKVVADWKLFSIALLKQDATFKYVAEPLSYFDADGLSLRPETFELIKSEQQIVLKEFFPLVFKDFEKIQKIGCSFSEIYNSSYIRKILKFRKKIISLFRK
jgi:hypothetical protein